MFDTCYVLLTGLTAELAQLGCLIARQPLYVSVVSVAAASCTAARQLQALLGHRLSHH
jgi:hypothetical protein